MVLKEGEYTQYGGWRYVDGELIFPDRELLDIFRKAGEKITTIGVERLRLIEVFVCWVDDWGAEGTGLCARSGMRMDGHRGGVGNIDMDNEQVLRGRQGCSLGRSSFLGSGRLDSLCCCCSCLICAEDMGRRNCLAAQVGAFTDAVRIVVGVATTRTAHSRRTIAVVLSKM